MRLPTEKPSQNSPHPNSNEVLLSHKGDSEDQAGNLHFYPLAPSRVGKKTKHPEHTVTFLENIRFELSKWLAD